MVAGKTSHEVAVSVMETTLAMSSGCAGSYGVAAGSLAAMAEVAIRVRNRVVRVFIFVDSVLVLMLEV